MGIVAAGIAHGWLSMTGGRGIAGVFMGVDMLAALALCLPSSFVVGGILGGREG